MRRSVSVPTFMAAVFVLSAAVHATQIRVGDATLFFDNYEDATNVAAGAIPGAHYESPNYNPDNPQVGSWYAFQGTDTETDPPTSFVQNVQVTDNVAGGAFNNPAFSPGAYSGTNYLRSFRSAAFNNNPGSQIAHEVGGIPTPTVAGQIYRFETMISSQLALTTGTTHITIGVYQLRDSDLSDLGNPITGKDIIAINFRSNGDILSNGVDTGLNWAADSSWQKMMIEYMDGEETFTFTYGNQSIELGLVPGSNGHALATTFGNGSGSANLNGGAGSRLFFDSVGLVPVPEPGAFLLMGMGLLGACVWKRRMGK